MGGSLAHNRDRLVVHAEHGHAAHHLDAVHSERVGVVGHEILQPVHLASDHPSHPFHVDLLQRVAVGREAKRAQRAHVDRAPQRPIAHKRHPQQRPPAVAWHHKVAAFVAHTAGHEAGIRGVEQGHVGVGHGYSLGINDSPHGLEALFLRAFHENQAVAHGQPHGVEAEHLAHGLGNGAAAQLYGDGEVLQFVVDKVDGIAAAGPFEVGEHPGKRHAMVAARDALGRQGAQRAEGPGKQNEAWLHGGGQLMVMVLSAKVRFTFSNRFSVSTAFSTA